MKVRRQSDKKRVVDGEPAEADNSERDRDERSGDEHGSVHGVGTDAP